MNQVMNPLFIIKILKSYFLDVRRIWDLDQQGMHEFQEKKLKQLIRYAYETVPFYRKKYDAVNLKPSAIQSLKDIKKIPFVTKQEFQNAKSIDLLPHPIRHHAIKTSTSGTKGKPLSIYVSLLDVIQGLFGYLRPFKEYGINWRKDNIAFILDLRSESVERMYLHEGIFPSFKPFLNFDNIRVFSLRTKAEDLITELDTFQPDFIGGYTGKLTHLALLKEEGLGKNIHPRAMGSTGEPLDNHIKALIQEAFDTDCYNTYGATEPGPIAFECRDRNLHVDADLILTEYINDGIPVRGEEPGNIVITKLFGNGTPIIRYLGMNDIVAPSTETCGCGMKHGIIKKIYGRDNWYLVFSNNSILLPSAIAEIFGKVVYTYRTRKFQGVQIMQNAIDNVEVRIIFNHKLKDKSNTGQLMHMLHEEFLEKISQDSKPRIAIKEVTEFKEPGYILSKVDIDSIKNKKYV